MSTISYPKGVSFFLQSPEWENFQKSVDRKVWRAGGALVVRHDLPLGFSYLYSPRVEPKLLTEVFFSEVAEIAKREGSVFLKIEPISNFQNSPPRRIHGLRPSKVKTVTFDSIFNFQTSNAIQPTKTTVLDLDRPEEEMLAQMHEKTRYNIRLAERRGVEVKSVSSVNSGNFQKFWELLRETAARDGFHTHRQEYYEKMLRVKSENFSNELFWAEYEGNVLAAAIVNFYRGSTSVGGAATYLHGASSRKHKEAMAPHLLHWRIMQEAKNRDFQYYDFWGIDEKKWPGLTRFKLGFGGNTFEYPPTLDIIYNQFYYWFYRAARRIT